MSVILKSISLPPLRLFSDLILLAFSPKNRNLFVLSAFWWYHIKAK